MNFLWSSERRNIENTFSESKASLSTKSDIFHVLSAKESNGKSLQSFLNQQPNSNLKNPYFPSILTKPQLLRKKNLEIERLKELARKNRVDCANAIAQEKKARMQEMIQRQNVERMRAQNKTNLKMERLRNKEKYLNENEQLKWERDEAILWNKRKDNLIQRLKMRVIYLEQAERQATKEIDNLKRKLECDNQTV